MSCNCQTDWLKAIEMQSCLVNFYEEYISLLQTGKSNFLRKHTVKCPFLFKAFFFFFLQFLLPVLWKEFISSLRKWIKEASVFFFFLFITLERKKKSNFHLIYKRNSRFKVYIFFFFPLFAFFFFFKGVFCK